MGAFLDPHSVIKLTPAPKVVRDASTKIIRRFANHMCVTP